MQISPPPLSPLDGYALGLEGPIVAAVTGGAAGSISDSDLADDWARRAWPQMFTTFAGWPAQDVTGVRVELTLGGSVTWTELPIPGIRSETRTETITFSHSQSHTFPLHSWFEPPYAAAGVDGSITPFSPVTSPRGLTFGGPLNLGFLADVSNNPYALATTPTTVGGQMGQGTSSASGNLGVGRSLVWAHPNRASALLSPAYSSAGLLVRTIKPHISLDPRRPRWAVQVRHATTGEASPTYPTIGTQTTTITLPGYPPWTSSTNLTPNYFGAAFRDGVAYVPAFSLLGWVRDKDAWVEAGSVGPTLRGHPTIAVCNDNHLWGGGATGPFRPGFNTWGRLAFWRGVDGGARTPNYEPIISDDPDEPYVRTPAGMRLHRWAEVETDPNVTEYNNTTEVSVQVWLERG